MCLFTNINSWSSNSSHKFKIWKEICSLQIFASKIQWYKSSEIYEIIKYVFLLIVLVLWQKWKFNTAWTWRYFTIFLSDLNTDYYMTSFEIQGMQPFYTQVSGLNAMCLCKSDPPFFLPRMLSFFVLYSTRGITVIIYLSHKK